VPTRHPSKEVQVGVPARAVGFVLGYAADLALGDPRRGRPVAGFGQLASVLERECRADDRVRGADYDGFRRAFLTEVASQAGVRWRADLNTQGFAARRESMLDRLADAIDHLDTAALTALVGVDL
jgi:hypothetical protein